MFSGKKFFKKIKKSHQVSSWVRPENLAAVPPSCQRVAHWPVCLGSVQEGALVFNPLQPNVSAAVCRAPSASLRDRGRNDPLNCLEVEFCFGRTFSVPELGPPGFGVSSAPQAWGLVAGRVGAR